MTDQLDRAAAILSGCCAHCDDIVDEQLALLDEAGLLASPERDEARAEVERLARAARAVDRLREVADGRVQHRYEGECPSAVEGHASRDRDCPACAALITAATWRIDPKEMNR